MKPLPQQQGGTDTDGVQFQKTGTMTSLERTASLSASVTLILFFLVLEVGKQQTNFRLMKSQDEIPVSPSFLVAVVEFTKLMVVVVWQIGSSSSFSYRPSLKFGIPAACYLVNNSLHLQALQVTSPPLWMVLIQTRTLFTAAAYKVVFRRELQFYQYLGCILIVASISLAKMSTLVEGNSNISTKVIIFSQVSAMLSATASLTIETLLKNDGRSFVEQQVWLYTWSTFLGIATLLHTQDLSGALHNIQTSSWSWPVWGLLLGAVATSSMAGLCIPHIVKRLDTVVKDYLVSLNNLVLAGVTAFLFPEEFSFSWPYLFSLLVLLGGIFLYEKKK